MPRPLRAKLEPVLSSPPGGPNGVSGVRVSFSRHAAGLSNAPFDENTPASLTFFARSFDKAGDSATAPDVALATLSGEVVLGPDERTSFIPDPQSLAALTTEPPGEPPIGFGLRVLALLLERPAFEGVPSSPLPRLFLPPETAEPNRNFLELRVSIEVAGSEEASPEVNDVLDVPLRPRPSFGLRLVDDVGEPLAALFELEVAGQKQQIQTDAQGWVRADSLGADRAKARIVDADALFERVRLRFDQARPGGRLGAGPEVTVVEPAGLAQLELPLESRLQTLSVQARAVQARLFGLFFETNKSFLLPGTIPSIRQIKELYDENPDSKLLIVGHTDTTGEPSLNDPLSLERAESVAAYLQDRVEVWVGRYSTSVSEGRRWGRREDAGMIKSLQLQGPQFPGKDQISRADPVRWYQEFHNALPAAQRAQNFESLQVDGKLGELTRKQLIGDYMNHDQTSLPSDIEITTHGCGENFPIDVSGFELDAAPRNDFEDPVDRRVELFFFDAALGIQPKPPGKNSGPGSKQYPEWRRRAKETFDFSLGSGNLAMRIPSRFSRARSFPKPSMLPGLLDVAQRLVNDPELSLVLVGHADATGTDDANFKVSLGRAEAVRAWLLGDREFFLQRFDDADPLLHWDWEEAQWMLHTARFGQSRCYVGAADGFPGLRTVDALGAFQLSTDELAVNYSLDRPTLIKLIDNYLGGIAEALRPLADRIEVVGGGSWHPPIPLGPSDGAEIDFDSPDVRRVEAFLFRGLPNPGVDAFPKQRSAPTVYALWCAQVQLPLVVERSPIALEVFDPDRRPMGNVAVQVALVVPDGSDAPIGSVTTSDSGNVDAPLPDGVFVAQVQRGSVAFTASFAVDHDESCGLSLAFDRGVAGATSVDAPAS